jgi:hypothetical protein
VNHFQRRCNEHLHFVNRYQLGSGGGDVNKNWQQNKQRAIDHKKKRMRRFKEADEK